MMSDTRFRAGLVVISIAIVAAAVVALWPPLSSLISTLWLAIFLKGKLLLKLLTPESIVAMFKRGTISHVKSTAIKTSAVMVVMSHAPWRRYVSATKDSIAMLTLVMLGHYRSLSTWMQLVFASVLLLATAGTGYVVFAFIAIPQPLWHWLKNAIVTIVNRSGVGAIINSAWRSLVPEDVSLTLYLFFKWKVGRRQIELSKRIHALINHA